LKSVVCPGHFDVGIFQGTKVVCIQNRLDIQEFWQNFVTSNLVLWCDGLKGKDDVAQSNSASKKRKVQSSTEEDVQKTINGLKKKHGSRFTVVSRAAAQVPQLIHAALL